MSVLAVVAVSPVLQADPVYRWLGADGVMHFSDLPPSGSAGELETLSLPPMPPPVAPDQDYYSVVNQAQRIDARRREEERLRLEREALEIEKAKVQQAAAPPPPPPPPEPRYILPYGYPYGPVFRPGPPGFHDPQHRHHPSGQGKDDPAPAPRRFFQTSPAAPPAPPAPE